MCCLHYILYSVDFFFFFRVESMFCSRVAGTLRSLLVGQPQLLRQEAQLINCWTASRQLTCSSWTASQQLTCSSWHLLSQQKISLLCVQKVPQLQIRQDGGKGCT